MTDADPRLVPILGSLDAEQRAAALLPDGPAQIVAPAGSGKTTTLVARLAVLLARGVPGERIAVVTFNREAAHELAARVASRLGPTFPGAQAIEVRTLHAMARQVMLDAHGPMELVADRTPLLRAARRRILAGGGPEPPEVSMLDAHLSRSKVEGRTPPDGIAAVLQAYGTLLEAHRGVDFDDLVTGAAELLETDPGVRAQWQERFSHLAVDEFQDVDAAQLRLVRALAGERANLFVVGDDDQTIYAWRLADVRRILGFASWYPAARRVILATNYRCPPEIVAAARRLVEHNAERFAKPIRAGRDGPPDAITAVSTAGADWPQRLVELVARAHPDEPACFLARTRSELIPLLVALTHAGIPHHSPVPAPIQADAVRRLLDDLTPAPASGHPFIMLRALRRARGWDRDGPDDELADEEHAAIDALVGWSVPYPTVAGFVADAERMRARVEALRRPDARVELLTAHGAKGREWPLVVLVGFEAERFPNRRALRDADEPGRAMEEERRLAYVAVTRATRRLVLAFDPARPSPFLAEMGYRGEP